jgi:hypothetical protein
LNHFAAATTTTILATMQRANIDHGGNVNRTSRIPQSLQTVILASNRGIEVHVPPPENNASKVFRRGFLGRTFSSDSHQRRATRKPVKQSTSFSVRFLPNGGKAAKKSDESKERPPVESILVSKVSYTERVYISPSSENSVCISHRVTAVGCAE